MSLPAAKVTSLWRYPVKSMLGEMLKTAEVTRRGLSGDRPYAVVDVATGKVASAKSPRKWARLFEFRASLAPESEGTNGHALRISLPNGTTVSVGRDDIDGLLSKELGCKVSLRSAASGGMAHTYEYDQAEEGAAQDAPVTEESMPDGTFFDEAVIHILTTATLRQLKDSHPEGRFAVERFRPNIVLNLADDQEGFVEEGWVGRTLRLGNEVRLRVTKPCLRCVMVNLRQETLPKDPDVLRTVARRNGGRAGVYAKVLRGGHVSIDDEVALD